VGETRVDLQHLLEDLRDAYTGSLEETILTEVIANGLDSGATRIRLTTNCVFIDTGKDKVLIDTGMGEKWSEKEIEIYGIKRERPFEDSLLAIAGCGTTDIDTVVNTHLHFVHAGGNTFKGSPPYEGGVVPAT
jgi:glyoxylase-like metal-dependent hydrolase (beta-lactamase superfamily II)